MELLSRSKPAKISSIYSYIDPKNRKVIERNASLAFDGNLVQNADFCTHSLKESISWIKVDLLFPSTVRSVKIYNRADSMGRARLQNADIIVSLEETLTKFNGELCTSFSKITTTNQIQEFRCSSLIRGRYVQLQIYNNYLCVCEMEVYGFR